jgi:hypothetical protein
LGRLNILKNSARNWRLYRSESFVIFCNEGLNVMLSGPKKAFLDRLPSSPIGGAAKQFGLR